MRANRWLAIALSSFVAITIPQIVFAQNEGYKLDSITVSSGDDPISSGITGSVQFVNEHNRLIWVAVQHEQAWLVYGQNFSKGRVSGLMGGSIGHFQGAPWAGPILALSVPVTKIAGQQISARTMLWPGMFAWEPRDWKTENNGIKNSERFLTGSLSSFGFDVGPVGFTYSQLNFLDDPWNTLLGISYTASIRKDVSTTGSATWNNNDEKWLLFLGLTWTPKRNKP